MAAAAAVSSRRSRRSGPPTATSRTGSKPPLTATYDNPYQEWIGALIRADIYGWTCPGAPRRAASLARRDAVLSHTGNGVYGAMWAAALVSAAFTAPSVRHAVRRRRWP